MPQQKIDRPYTEAMRLIEDNCDEKSILERCDIAQAELDLLKRLMVFARPNLRIDSSLARFRKEGK